MASVAGSLSAVKEPSATECPTACREAACSHEGLHRLHQARRDWDIASLTGLRRLEALPKVPAMLDVNPPIVDILVPDREDLTLPHTSGGSYHVDRAVQEVPAPNS
jgi:hypothetical protein